MNEKVKKYTWRCEDCHRDESAKLPSEGSSDEAQRAALRHITATGHQTVLAESEDGFQSMRPQWLKNVEIIDKAKGMGFATAVAGTDWIM